MKPLAYTLITLCLFCSVASGERGILTWSTEEMAFDDGGALYMFMQCYYVDIDDLKVKGYFVDQDGKLWIKEIDPVSVSLIPDGIKVDLGPDYRNRNGMPLFETRMTVPVIIEKKKCREW